MPDNILNDALNSVLSRYPSSPSATPTPQSTAVYTPPAVNKDSSATGTGVIPPPTNQPDLPLRNGVINAPSATFASGPAVADPDAQKANPGSQFIARGRQTVFGLNYDGSIDKGDNGIGFFRDPVTGRPYDTQNPNLVGASLNVGIFNGTIGNRYDKNIQAAVSKGQYKVQVTTDDGKSLILPMVDNGPAGWTGNAIDLTKGATDALGIKDNSILNYQIIGPDGKPMPLKNTPPVPVTSNASGQTRGQQYQQQLDQYYAERQPYAPGIKIATPDQVAKWDYAVQNNLINPESVSPEDKLAVAVAKDPQYLVRPENSDLFYHFVAQPLMKTSVADQISSGLANLPVAGSSLLSGLKDTANASFENASAWGKMVWNQMAKNNNGQGQVPVDMGQVGTNMASGVQGTVKGFGDVVNMINGAQAAVDGVARPIIESFIQDPNQRQQIDKRYSDILQETLRNQYNSAQVGQQVQQNVSAAYKALGQTTVADALSNASPKQNVTDTIGLITNPLNYIPFGESAAASKAVIPSFFEHALDNGAELGGKIAEAGATRASAVVPDGGLSSFVSKPLPNAITAADPIGTSEVAKVVGAQGTQTLNAEKAANQASQDFSNSSSLVAKYLQDQEGVGGSALGRGTQLTGQGVQLAGKGLEALLKAPDALAKRLIPNNPELASRVGEQFRWAMDGGVDALIGGEGTHSLLAGLVGGPLAMGALRLGPSGLKNVGEFLSTAGKELIYGKTTLPFWNRVAQETTGLGSGIANLLDKPAIYTLGAAAKGSLIGGATGAGLGALSNPLQPYSGATQGAVQGGILGMMGGGFGQISDQGSLGNVTQRMAGDWKRYRDMLPAADRGNFDKLDSTNQLALSQFSHQFPGLKVDYINDPNDVGGAQHYGNNVTINTAQPGSTIQGLLAHELAHSVAENGLLPDLYRELLGEPATKTPGQYTLRDSNAPDGVAHIDPTTGRYKTNQDFQNLKNTYVQALADKNKPTSHLTDLNIAKEIFAEHGAQYALSGQGTVDTNSAFRPGWLSNQYTLKNAMMKMGLAFKTDGNVIKGTGLFHDNLQPNSAVSKLIQTYYQKRFDDRKIVTSESDQMPDRAFAKKDLITSPNAVDHWFDSTPSVLRDKNGVVQKDGTGAPVIRSQSEVAKYNTGLSRSVNDFVGALPEDRRAELGITQKGEHNVTLRYMPDELLDNLAAKNQYNPNQMENLRTLSKSMADRSQAGRMFNFFYQTASKGKQYATLAGAERNIIPYLFETTKDGNTNLKGVDFGQLTNNYFKYQKNATVKKLWQTANDFNTDADTYFGNHAQGKPGAEGIGPEKRDVINALAGLGTSVNKEMNPFTSQTPQAKSIIKSFRIDRINRLSPTDVLKDFKDERQYNAFLNRNYHPGAPSFADKFLDTAVNTPALRKVRGEYDRNNGEMTSLVRSSFDTPSPDASSRWSQLYGRQKAIESQISPAGP